MMDRLLASGLIVSVVGASWGLSWHITSERRGAVEEASQLIARERSDADNEYASKDLVGEMSTSIRVMAEQVKVLNKNQEALLGEIRSYHRGRR